MSAISDLKNANRIQILQQIALNDNIIQFDVFNSIASDHYHEFIDFCDTVFQNKDNIENIKCTVTQDALNFEIKYYK